MKNLRLALALGALALTQAAAVRADLLDDLHVLEEAKAITMKSGQGYQNRHAKGGDIRGLRQAANDYHDNAKSFDTKLTAFIAKYPKIRNADEKTIRQHLSKEHKQKAAKVMAKLKDKVQRYKQRNKEILADAQKVHPPKHGSWKPVKSTVEF